MVEKDSVSKIQYFGLSSHEPNVLILTVSKLTFNRAISVTTRNVLGEVFNLVFLAHFSLEVAIERITQIHDSDATSFKQALPM